MKEKWKIVREYPHYQVSNLGRVASFRRSEPIILKPQLTSQKCAYAQVRLFNGENNKGDLWYIHRLVAHTWIRPLTSEDHIHHKDNDSHNNELSNITITNQSEHLLKYHSKFDKEKIKQLREDIIKGKRGDGVKLAKKYDVDKAFIYRVKNNLIYANIGRWRKAMNEGLRNFTHNEIKQIREDSKRMNFNDLADLWNISYQVAYRIVNGYSYTDVT